MPLQLTAFVISLFLHSALFAAPQPAAKHAVPVEVKRVLIDPASNSPVVLLEAVDTEAVVPIWIGPAEAASIALELEQRELPRPNTHDLIGRLLAALDAELNRVTVTELKENTYYAVITLVSGDRELHIDSRPSDAIAVALRAEAPIYAAPELLNRGTGLSALPSTRETNAITKTMGIHVQDLTANLADLLDSPQREGVLVAHVELDSLASRVGFQRGDVITGVDETRVNNTSELEEAFQSHEQSEKIDFRIQRGGKLLTIAVNMPPQ